MILMTLPELVKLAATPGTTASVYRPALREAIRLTRLTVRRYDARRTLPVGILRPSTVTNWATEPSVSAYVPGAWTGD